MNIEQYIYEDKNLLIGATALTVGDIANLLEQGREVDVFYQLLAFTNFVRARQMSDTDTHTKVLRDALEYYTSSSKRNIWFDINTLEAVEIFFGPHAVSLAKTLVGLGYEPHTVDFVDRLRTVLENCYPCSELDLGGDMGVEL